MYDEIIHICAGETWRVNRLVFYAVCHERHASIRRLRTNHKRAGDVTGSASIVSRISR